MLVMDFVTHFHQPVQLSFESQRFSGSAECRIPFPHSSESVLALIKQAIFLNMPCIFHLPLYVRWAAMHYLWLLQLRSLLTSLCASPIQPCP